MSYSFFVLLSLMEGPEPDWNEKITSIKLPEEMVFDLDPTIKGEIERMREVADDRVRTLEYIKLPNLTTFSSETLY